MATKKKTIEETIAENSVKETSAKSETPAKKAPRKFAQEDPILCRSVTYGELLLPGKKSKLLYSWAGCGDTTEVYFQDLQALRSTRSQYLNAPLFVIEDEELLEQWPELKALYEKVASIDIDKLFDLPIAQFKKKLCDLPVGFRDSVKNTAGAMILDGTLDSIKKIEALDEILGTDLKLHIQ